MKTLILICTSLAFMLAASPALADDKQRRIGGVKTEKSAQHSSRGTNSDRRTRGSRDANRNTDRNTGRDANRNANRDYRSDRRVQGTRDRRQHNDRNTRRRAVVRDRYAANNRHHYQTHAYTARRNHQRRSYYRTKYHDNRYGYLLGGVVLGSLLSHHDHSYSHYPRRSRVVVTRVVRDGSYGRINDIYLFRDRYGDCFEVRENKYGDEVREEIAPEYCDW